jgi:VCBS repeat-containing protein
MQFLAAGESLMNLSSEPQKYEIAKQGWLPKFEPAHEFQISHVDAHSKSSVTQLAKTTSVGAVVLKEKREKTARASKVEDRPAVLRQGELKLDNIKVVRNDLSESDFELKVHGSTRTAVVKDQGNWSKVPYKAGLNWLAARFFRTSKTQI